MKNNSLKTNTNSILRSKNKVTLTWTKARTEILQSSQRLQNRLESISSIDSSSVKQTRKIPGDDFSLDLSIIQSSNIQEIEATDKNRDPHKFQKLSHASGRSKKKQLYQQKSKKLQGKVSIIKQISQQKAYVTFQFQQLAKKNKRLAQIYNNLKEDGIQRQIQLANNSSFKNKQQFSPVQKKCLMNDHI